jgi:hypothetical protein
MKVGEKESFQAQCMRDSWSSLLSRSILPKGSTGGLEARGDLHSWAMVTMKKAWEIWLFAVDMAGEDQDLAAFGASGRIRKLHLQPLGGTGECPSHNTFCGLKTNFPFHRLFSDFPLSWSDL